MGEDGFLVGESSSLLFLLNFGSSSTGHETMADHFGVASKRIVNINNIFKKVSTYRDCLNPLIYQVGGKVLSDMSKPSIKKETRGCQQLPLE